MLSIDGFDPACQKSSGGRLGFRWRLPQPHPRAALIGIDECHLFDRGHEGEERAERPELGHRPAEEGDE